MSHGEHDRLTHWMPVSTNTYSSLSQSNSTYRPMLLERLIHTKPASKRASGSSRNTFITIPSVLNDRRVEKYGLICSSESGFCSGKWICISSNCITFSSSLDRGIQKGYKTITNHRRKQMERTTHFPRRTLAMVKYTIRCSNSTRHFHNSHRSPGFHSAMPTSRCTSQQTTLPLFVAQRV